MRSSYAVDRNPGALRTLEREAAVLQDRAGDGRAPRIVCTQADFTREVFLPPLDGVLMANALHFHADACGILCRIARWLKPGGVLILVEYDIDAAQPLGAASPAVVPLPRGRRLRGPDRRPPPGNAAE